ncbi:uncharacterized protein Dana_GF22669 [Drosophila ananassae]|uniref:Uncharacterized protein n=1 Tax=Drosophila ananassae TaxID=7217 RepID=B3MWC8_DROAN|nr:uncharacterized protein LOC6505324 [Drosophila ananassae]EDV35273.2 uncharacterized protein Dana_GF22669 [Drosophila ananassae]
MDILSKYSNGQIEESYFKIKMEGGYGWMREFLSSCRGGRGGGRNMVMAYDYGLPCSCHCHFVQSHLWTGPKRPACQGANYGAPSNPPAAPTATPAAAVAPAEDDPPPQVD